MFRATVLTLVFLTAAEAVVQAQSTDPNRPTPWPTDGVNGSGAGRRVTYYYSLPVGAGPMRVRTSVRARSFSTAVSVNFLDDSRNSVYGAGAIGTASGQSNDVTLNVTIARTYLVSVAIDENTATYSVIINPTAPAMTPPMPPTPVTPVPPRRPVEFPKLSGTTPDGGVLPGLLNPPPPVRPMPGTGTPTPGGTGTTFPAAGITATNDGREHDTRYTVNAGPGSVTITVEAQARVFSTAVNVGLYDASGNLIREVGAIATAAGTQRERATVRLDMRGNYTVRVRIDANCGRYAVQVEGDVHR